MKVIHVDMGALATAADGLTLDHHGQGFKMHQRVVSLSAYRIPKKVIQRCKLVYFIMTVRKSKVTINNK